MNPSPRPEVIVALPVAFDGDGRLDLEGTREVFRAAAGSGVDGAFILGTTGEFLALSLEERVAIMQIGVEELSNIRCIAHVGSASAYEVLKLIEQVREVGLTEVAVLTPYYLPTTDQAMFDFFATVAAASEGLRAYLYVFSDRTGNAVSDHLMERLARLPNVVGAKISGEPLERVSAYRAVVPDNFILYTGSDRDIARAAEAGAQGVVSGIASALPKPFVHMAARLASGASPEELRQAQEAVDEAVDVIQGDMARMKAALRFQGVNAGYPRMAIEQPSPESLSAIRRVVARHGALADTEPAQ